MLGRQGAGPLARDDLGQGAHASLGLGDHLVGDGQDVAGPQLGSRRRRPAARRGRRRAAPRGGPEARWPRSSSRDGGGAGQDPAECRAGARRAPGRRASAARSAARSPGVSTSSVREAGVATAGRAPARSASSRWRSKLPGPERGREQVRRREQQRVGPGPVAVGHDHRRLRPREQLLDLGGVERGAVAGHQRARVRRRARPRRPRRARPRRSGRPARGRRSPACRASCRPAWRRGAPR